MSQLLPFKKKSDSQGSGECKTSQTGKGRKAVQFSFFRKARGEGPEGGECQLPSKSFARKGTMDVRGTTGEAGITTAPSETFAA